MSKTLEDVLREGISKELGWELSVADTECQLGTETVEETVDEVTKILAVMLTEAGFGSLHDAWADGVATALNHAIENDDGMTLRLEHLDGRPWANPYPKVSET